VNGKTTREQQKGKEIGERDKEKSEMLVGSCIEEKERERLTSTEEKKDLI